MKKKGIAVVLVLLGTIVLAVGGAAGFFAFNYFPLSRETAYQVRLTIPLGATTQDVARLLYDEHLVRSPQFVYYFIRFKENVIKAGNYTLHSGMNLGEIIAELESGKQEHISVSIPEGYTVGKIAAILEEKDICAAALFRSAAADPALLEKINAPFPSAEGFLFPDTYFFYSGMDPALVVTIMVENFYKRIGGLPEFADMLTPAAQSRLFRIVTLASIVEREYRRPEEAPLIASVFSNRLRYNIGLYSCATIEYIITEILGRPHPDIITYDDLAIDSRYNTYKHAGLPPSPIANPGLVALRAAANPPQTPYYFFRVVDPAKGAHHLSTDLEEHMDVGTALYTKRAAGS
jgi:UPF0755 protein